MSKFNKINKTKLSLIGSFAILLAIVFTMVSTTYAWFTNKNSEIGNIDNITVKDESVIKKVTYFQQSTLDGSNMGFNINTNDNYSFKMKTYSILDPKYRLLIKVDLLENITSLKISAHTNTTNTPYIAGNANSDNKEIQLKESDNPLSNIVDFAIVDVTTDESSYFVDESSVTYTNLLSTKDDSTYVMDEVTLNENYSISNNTLFIMVNYNKAEIEKIYSAYIGSDVIENATFESGIPFKLDFYFLLDKNIA